MYACKTGERGCYLRGGHCIWCFAGKGGGCWYSISWQSFSCFYFMSSQITATCTCCSISGCVHGYLRHNNAWQQCTSCFSINHNARAMSTWPAISVEFKANHPAQYCTTLKLLLPMTVLARPPKCLATKYLHLLEQSYNVCVLHMVDPSKLIL